MSVILPIAVDDRERALWESRDAVALLDRLAGQLALLGREHSVLAVGKPEVMPAWVQTLGVPVRPVPVLAEPHNPLLPPGTLSALRALAATFEGAEARVAVMDFRSVLISARTVCAAIGAFCRDGHTRVSVGEPRFNAAIVECPGEILAAGHVAMIDDEALPLDLPATLPDAQDSSRVSRRFHFNVTGMNWTGYPLADGPWHAVVSTWYLDYLMPEVVPVCRLGFAKYADARIHSVLFRENDSQVRRLVPAVSLPEGFTLRGLDTLWSPKECSVVCLERNGGIGVWLHESLAARGAVLRAWAYCSENGSLRACKAGPQRVGEAGERVDVSGRVFVGPVMSMDPGCDALVWRLERPVIGEHADFVEPVSVRRDLWGLDPATGFKVCLQTGEFITGRQRYPENLSPTRGLAVGRVNDLERVGELGGRGVLRGIRLAHDEACSVKDVVSLIRCANALGRREQAVGRDEAPSVREAQTLPWASVGNLNIR